jgi:hypothetical protein
MGIAMSVTGSYTIGFLLLAAVAACALVVATGSPIRRPADRPALPCGGPTRHVLDV